MKKKERIEKNLFDALDRKEKIKDCGLMSKILMNEERIKVLEWVLSDKIDDLDKFKKNEKVF